MKFEAAVICSAKVWKFRMHVSIENGTEKKKKSETIKMKPQVH